MKISYVIFYEEEVHTIESVGDRNAVRLGPGAVSVPVLFKFGPKMGREAKNIGSKNRTRCLAGIQYLERSAKNLAWLLSYP